MSTPLVRVWKDCGTYWLNVSEQRSENWHRIRTGRVTASNFGSAVGHSKFTGLDELADDIAGIKKKVFDARAVSVMGHGTVTEPIARDWYAKNQGVEVEELGLAVPKWDIRIGASLDGDVGQDGMIEIKCPLKMYQPLRSHMEATAAGWQPPPMYHDHIWSTHYDQMQGGMAITGKKWCDYVVFCTPEDSVFLERVLFNQEYWNKTLYPGLDRFIRERLEPRMHKNHIFREIPS